MYSICIIKIEKKKETTKRRKIKEEREKKKKRKRTREWNIINQYLLIIIIYRLVPNIIPLADPKVDNATKMGINHFTGLITLSAHV